MFIKTSYEHRKLADLNIEPTLVIDAGFNTGKFSTLALEIWKESNVIAFDPYPEIPSKYANKIRSFYGKRFKFL